MRTTWLALALVCGLTACGGGTPPAAAPKIAPRDEPADAQGAAAELVRLAAEDDRAALNGRVDWPWVRRLAAMTEAFEPSLPHLLATLTIPAGCAIEWRVDEGGQRLDFPPPMVDDDPRTVAEKELLKDGLYQGNDVVAVCGGQEQMVVQVVRDPAGAWWIRGWARLRP